MPASAARAAPSAVQTQRSLHQPEAQPSSGSREDRTASVEVSSSSSWDEVTAMPGTNGCASEPSTAAAPPMSFESALTSVSTGSPRSAVASRVVVRRT